eukprot:CAMPEP_0196656878 /NCGR_PEP_ID=MMETSP1086-20130531/20073_1 /TAXON_ID=77921 /ORGANISM="Cyanoptyche  gloeocystis , Strain SAG4.97" /LENGTH=203 /DNA_ID=CAMNT_0041989789 /DNA_START=83 /DNA_END=694 /DNA_ORIENTATION=+
MSPNPFDSVVFRRPSKRRMEDDDTADHVAKLMRTMAQALVINRDSCDSSPLSDDSPSSFTVNERSSHAPQSPFKCEDVCRKIRNHLRALSAVFVGSRLLDDLTDEQLWHVSSSLHRVDELVCAFISRAEFTAKELLPLPDRSESRQNISRSIRSSLLAIQCRAAHVGPLMRKFKHLRTFASPLRQAVVHLQRCLWLLETPEVE